MQTDVNPRRETAPGGLPWDYVWAFVQIGGTQGSSGLVAPLARREAYALVRSGGHEIGVLVVDGKGAGQNEDRALRYDLGNVFVDLAFDPVPTAETSAGRMLFVGELGLGVLK